MRVIVVIASSTRSFPTPRDGTPTVINPCPSTQDQDEKASVSAPAVPRWLLLGRGAHLCVAGGDGDQCLGDVGRGRRQPLHVGYGRGNCGAVRTAVGFVRAVGPHGQVG